MVLPGKKILRELASVQAKDFNKGIYTSPDQLIQGKAAGVLVINNTGQPGGSTTVRIRGSSSIRSGNQPLFVIDGVPLSGGSARPGGRWYLEMMEVTHSIILTPTILPVSKF